MKTHTRTTTGRLALLALAATLASSCARRPAGVDPETYNREIREWKERRLTRLTSPTGWLTLCGLFWLKEGDNGCGSDSTNPVRFPRDASPPFVGSITLSGGKARFVAKEGVRVTLGDSLIRETGMKSDRDADEPTILSVGTLRFYIIVRGTELGVRVKNTENPARLNFKGLEYFPVDPAWRIEARFEPYVPPKILSIASMVGTVETDSCPGALVFEAGGAQQRLDVVVEQGSEDQFFIMFSDETSGKETYAVGRQLYAALPDSLNRVILDFNKAYNWPCVFTEFATCPIPPRQNHLPLRVEAGELMVKGH